jgi:acetyltransferase-like isoleucine patch superfamily enzyme
VDWRTGRIRELKRVATNAWVSRGDQRSIQIGRDCWFKPSSRVQTEQGGTITIGNGVRINEHSLVQSLTGDIVLQDGVFVGAHCALYGLGGLHVGQDTMIAGGTIIIPANHIFSDPSRPIRYQGLTCIGVRISRDVWIASHVTVLDGVTIGEGAVVAAGAVVNRDVPPFAIVGGVPARVIGRRGADLA